jgi:hypothetical protein
LGTDTAVRPALRRIGCRVGQLEYAGCVVVLMPTFALMSTLRFSLRHVLAASVVVAALVLAIVLFRIYCADPSRAMRATSDVALVKLHTTGSSSRPPHQAVHSFLARAVRGFLRSDAQTAAGRRCTVEVQLPSDPMAI